MDIKASISATREGFEESFCSGDFYNKQTQDCGHLEQIMSFLPIKDGKKCSISEQEAVICRSL